MVFEVHDLVRRWKERLRYIRLRPFCTDTESGRAQERMRRIGLSAAALVIAKLFSAAITVLTVPLTIGYLGSERYGLWLTLSSTLAMMTFADLGIGNGLLTRIADADGRGDRCAIQSLISSALVMLSVVALLLSVTLICTSSRVDWPGILNLRTSLARAEAHRAVLLLGLITFVGMPLGLVQKVQSGLQDGYVSAVWAMLGSALSLVLLVVAALMKAGLAGLIFALAGAPLLVSICNFGWYFVRKPWCRPRLRLAQVKQMLDLLRLGAMFVILQLAVAFAFLSDNLVVARTFSAASVPSLAVPAKLFSLVLLPLTLVTGALWPAYGEALARGDVSWVKRTLTRITFGGVAITAVCSVLLVAVGPAVVRVWTHGVVNPNVQLMVSLAIWTVFCAWGQSVAAFLNGTGHVGAQAISGISMAITAFALKWYLIGPWGLAGTQWATILAYSMLTVVPLHFVVKAILKRETTTHGG